jgi:hypothetical protein
MRPTSIVGPLILVAVGILLLWINLSSDRTVLESLAIHWPWILVGWGVVRLLELLLWRSQEKSLPVRGISGGEWFVVVVVCVIGTGAYVSNQILGGFGDLPFQLSRTELFGEIHEFAIPEQKVTLRKGDRVLVENLRGNVEITGTNADEVSLNGAETVKAVSEDQARSILQSRKVTLERQDGIVVIRTHQEGVPGEHELRANLRIQVPSQVKVETRGRHTNYEIQQVRGGVEIQGDEGDARLADVAGTVRVRIARSRNIHLTNVDDLVEIYSNRGDDLSLENIRGKVSAVGTFNGNIQLRSIQGPVHIDDRRLDLRAASIPGEVVANRGDLKASRLTGPLRIASESKDVELAEFTGPLELVLEKRDAIIRQTNARLSPMDLQVRRGKVVMELPPTATFRFEGRARKGEIIDDLKTNELKEESSSQQSVLAGGPAGAPLISVDAERIELLSIVPRETAKKE